jgi:hypothetical protein
MLRFLRNTSSDARLLIHPFGRGDGTVIAQQKACGMGRRLELVK